MNERIKSRSGSGAYNCPHERHIRSTEKPKTRRTEVMSKIIKNTMTAVVTSGLIIGSTAAVMAPATASARTTYQCEVTKSNNAKTGAILGAIAGGLLGSQVAKNEKGLGAVGGAVVGGLLGNKLGRDQGKDT